MKRCSKCEQAKPASEYHKRAKSSDGLQGHCRDCARKASAKRYADPVARERMLQRNRDWHKANRESVAERHTKYRRDAGVPPAHRVDPNATHKTCPRCEQSIPMAEWSGSYCKPCNCEQRREWYDKNRERAIATIRDYEARNPKETAQARRAGASAYRARRRGAVVDGVAVTGSAISARWAMFGNQCWICGEDATETDHVIPLSGGGLHVPANLRPACRHCNATKNARGWRAFVTNED